MASLNGIPGEASARYLQQGMSPTLDGEEHGPNYARTGDEPLRDVSEPRGSVDPAQTMNGALGTIQAPSAPVASERATGQPNAVSGDGARSASLDARQQVLPSPEGRDSPAQPLHEPGPERSHDVPMYTADGEPLFAGFQPSPLPGQSPVSETGPGNTRTGTWFSRLGDYIQRRVEVTSWSSAQSAAAQVATWPPAPQATSPRIRTQPFEEARAPSSSGSAGISPEALQAEVAKQLEVAMGGVLQRLQVERTRTEEAMQEAQRLRRQLEHQEARMSGTSLESPYVMVPEPPRLPLLSPGVCPEVPTDQPPRGPFESAGDPNVLGPAAVSLRGPVEGPGSDLVHPPAPLRLRGPPGSDVGARLPVGDPSAASVSNVRSVLSAGVSEVPADQPPRGSFFSDAARTRARSQSPTGPRAFLQGLFGLGSGTRDDRPTMDNGMQPSLTHAPPLPPQHAPQPPLPPPIQPSHQSKEQRGDDGDREGQLLMTLARGIEALLIQQQAGKGDRPETVKPGISELPVLPEYEPATGSIDLLHWITHIGPIMEDLSDTSAAWWHATMKDALQWYSQYSRATPLQKLQLKPQPSLELSKPEWSRVERRATAMLLTAVPKSVREEIIAYGEVTSLSVLCKLYAVYQPGNLQEKGLVLRMLEQPEPCNTALEAVEGLRRWSLWRTRATTIGMAEPDASVLVRGLDRITNTVIQGSGELSFRVSLIRSTLQVGVSPSASTVTSFLQHLQAEMEQQARLGATRTGGEAAPSLKAITTTYTSTPNSPSPDNSTSTPTTRPSNGVCKFFAGDRGCRRGNTCRFPHTWSLLEKGARSKKCL